MTITKQSACDIVNNAIALSINAGCQWGSDNYPPGSNPAWFAGPVAGLANRLTADAGAFSGNVENDILSDTIRYFIGFFACIRRARLITYMQGNGLYGSSFNGGWYTYYSTPNNSNNWNAWTLLVHDGHAVGNYSIAHVPALAKTTEDLPALRIPQAVNAITAHIQNYCDALASKHKQWGWGTRDPNGNLVALPTLTNTVCHVSCHSNCHGSRNRR